MLETLHSLTSVQIKTFLHSSVCSGGSEGCLSSALGMGIYIKKKGGGKERGGGERNLSPSPSFPSVVESAAVCP